MGSLRQWQTQAHPSEMAPPFGAALQRPPCPCQSTQTDAHPTVDSWTTCDPLLAAPACLPFLCLTPATSPATVALQCTRIRRNRESAHIPHLPRPSQARRLRVDDARPSTCSPSHTCAAAVGRARITTLSSDGAHHRRRLPLFAQQLPPPPAAPTTFARRATVPPLSPP